jgi:hypothetical protein
MSYKYRCEINYWSFDESGAGQTDVPMSADTVDSVLEELGPLLPGEVSFDTVTDHGMIVAAEMNSKNYTAPKSNFMREVSECNPSIMMEAKIFAGDKLVRHDLALDGFTGPAQRLEDGRFDLANLRNYEGLTYEDLQSSKEMRI